MANQDNIFKNIFSYASKEIKERLNSKKEFSSSGIPAHDPDFMYDLYTREFAGMNSRNILTYIDLARRGCPFYFYKYFDVASKRDTRIRVMLRKVKTAILNEQYTVTGDWAEGVEFCEKVIAHLGTKLQKFFTDAVNANIRGLQRFEINYEISDGYWMPSSLRAIPGFVYLYDDLTREYSFLDVTKFDQVSLKSTLSAQSDRIDISKFPKSEIHPLRLLDVYAIDGDDENAFMNGIVIALLFAYYFKSYNVKDMNIFLERFASPTVKMSYDSLNAKSKDELIKAYKEMKAHGAIVYPDGSQIDLLNDTQKGQAGNLYLTAINYWNSEITILLAGEEETTQMGSKGSLAALQVKQKISDLITQMNLKTCADAFNDLLKRLIYINFANPKEYPVFEYLKISTLNDKEVQSRINKNLKDIGVRPTLESLEEQFDVELEEVIATQEKDPEKDSKDSEEDPEEDPEDDSEEDPEKDFSFLDELFKQSGGDN